MHKCIYTNTTSLKRDLRVVCIGSCPHLLMTAEHKPDKRPWEKILLLTGGPGVGKTTLAHVLARHAGYFAMEINASMERTEKELKQHFLSATGMCV